MHLVPAILVLLASRAVTPPADELQRRLAALSAPTAEERAAAERWLGGHLAPQDYAELSRTAREGDAEVRLRLARVLGGDERHLGLALRFLVEPDAALASIGREAVHASVVSFDPHLGDAPVRGRELEERLRKLADGGIPRLVRVDPSRPLERTLRALSGLVDLPVGLVVDEDIAERAIRREEEPLVGSWSEVLLRLADLERVTLEAHGGGDEPDHAPLFLRFSSQGAEAATRGVDLVPRWLETCARPGDLESRSRAARNLIASGFLPASGWLDARLRTGADEAALEGLLVGAAGGRVAPVLREPSILRGLLGGLSTAPDERLVALVRGLGRIGCQASDGTSIPALLLEDFGAVDARGRWARLRVCGELGCPDPAVERVAGSVLAAETAPASLRRRALAALAALGEPAPQVPEPARRDLVRTVTDNGDAERLAREFLVTALEPPGGDHDFLASLSPPAQRALLLARLVRQDTDEAVRLLGALVSRQTRQEVDATTRVLERLVREGEREAVLELVARARRAADTPALERIAICLGALDEADLSVLAGRGPGWLEAADSVLLGALTGTLPGPSELGAAARSLLLQRASMPGETVDADLLDGFERAMTGLLERRRDEQAGSFARAAQAALRAEPRSEAGRALAARLQRVPGLVVLDVEVEGRERNLPPGE